MESLIIETEQLTEYIQLLGTAFCGGFTITVALHYIAYGIFKAYSYLVNIKK